VRLTDDELGALVVFLAALTDEASLAGRLGIPETVPSGLPVDRLPETEVETEALR
jgi:cytochrome c peroxidase